MPRKRYSTEQIVAKLRQTEVELGRGLRTPQVCKKLGISEQMHYGYPPDKREETVITVIEQAEAVCRDWAEAA